MVFNAEIIEKQKRRALDIFIKWEDKVAAKQYMSDCGFTEQMMRDVFLEAEKQLKQRGYSEDKINKLLWSDVLPRRDSQGELEFRMGNVEWADGDKPGRSERVEKLKNDRTHGNSNGDRTTERHTKITPQNRQQMKEEIRQEIKNETEYLEDQKKLAKQLEEERKLDEYMREEWRKNDEEQRRKDEEFLKPILPGKNSGSFYDRMREVDEVISHDEPPNSSVFTPEFVSEYIRSSKPVGYCKKCGSALIRDPEGHIGCSNLACGDTIFRPDRWRRYKTGLRDGWLSTKIGFSKYGRIISDKLARNVEGISSEGWKRQDELRAAGDENRKRNDRPTETSFVKEDAIANFRAGMTFNDAVKNQIEKYSGWGWWDLKDASNKSILRLQKNEVKSIIWDVYRNPGRYGIDWNEIHSNENIKNAYKSSRGFLGISGGLRNQLVKIGNDSNRKNMGKISEMQNRLAQLDDDESEWKKKLDDAKTEEEEKKCNSELEVIAAEKNDLLNKIKLIEEHPDLAGRMHARTKSNLAGLGGWLRRRHEGYKDAKDKIGSGVISKYSSFKEKASSGIQLLLAIIIFGSLIWLTLTEAESFMPINIYQVFVFIVLTLILAAIKYSLSEDQDGAAEARELVLILTVLFTFFAIFLGWSGPSPWASLIFCFILGVYVFFLFYTNSVLFSFILFFIMAFLVYFTMAGWTNEIGIIVEKTAQQTGFYDAIQTTFSSIGAGMSDVWMMLTNPTAWSEKKEMEQTAQKNEGQTNRALEISKTEVRPSNPKAGYPVDVVVEATNFGTQRADKPARNAKISLINDKKYIDVAELKIAGEKSATLDGETVKMATRDIGDILSGTGAEEVFEVQTPECIATFSMMAEVSYEYTVDATTNIFIIDKSRYDELTKQDKFVSEKQVTKSSAGPISIAMRTNIDQPIPISKDTKRDIRFHFGFINERSGSEENKINISSVTITIPTEFKVLFQNAAVEDYICEFCLLKADNGKGAGEYSLKDMYEGNAGDNCGTLKSGGIEIPEGIYTCSIEPTDEIKNVYFQKPFNVRAKVDYRYKYKKNVSFSVRNADISHEKVQCTAS